MSPRLAHPRPGIIARGVHVCPYFGPDGEMVIMAVKADGRQLEPPLVIPHGADRVALGESLWDRLEAADPQPMLRVS